MNSDDPFEQRLRNQPIKTVPPAWRSEILSAATAIRDTSLSEIGTQPARVNKPLAWLYALLWPHPGAWAGLAALWLLILGLNSMVREPAGSVVQQVIPQSPQMREQLRQQEELFAELIGPRENPAADRPRPSAPGPHSERREETCHA